jgi:hypothetical protein
MKFVLLRRVIRTVAKIYMSLLRLGQLFSALARRPAFLPLVAASISESLDGLIPFFKANPDSPIYNCPDFRRVCRLGTILWRSGRGPAGKYTVNRL